MSAPQIILTILGTVHGMIALYEKYHGDKQDAIWHLVLCFGLFTMAGMQS